MNGDAVLSSLREDRRMRRQIQRIYGSGYYEHDVDVDDDVDVGDRDRDYRDGDFGDMSHRVGRGGVDGGTMIPPSSVVSVAVAVPTPAAAAPPPPSGGDDDGDADVNWMTTIAAESGARMRALFDRVIGRGGVGGGVGVGDTAATAGGRNVVLPDHRRRHTTGAVSSSSSLSSSFSSSRAGVFGCDVLPRGCRDMHRNDYDDYVPSIGMMENHSHRRRQDIVVVDGETRTSSLALPPPPPPLRDVSDTHESATTAKIKNGGGMGGGISSSIRDGGCGASVSVVEDRGMWNMHRKLGRATTSSSSSSWEDRYAANDDDNPPGGGGANACGWMNISSQDGGGDRANYWIGYSSRHSRRRIIALLATIGFVIFASMVSVISVVAVRRRRDAASSETSMNAAAEIEESLNEDSNSRGDGWDVNWKAETNIPTYGPSSGPISEVSGEESGPGGSVTWDVDYDSTMAPSPAATTDRYPDQRVSSSPTGTMDPTTVSPTVPLIETYEPSSSTPTSAVPSLTESTSTEPAYTTTPPTYEATNASSSSSSSSSSATCGNGDRGNGVCPNDGKCCGNHGWCVEAPQPCKTPKPTARPTGPSPQDGGGLSGESSIATEGKVDAAPAKSRLHIKLRTDEHGEETSWTLYSVDSTVNGQMKLIASVGVNTYGPFEEDVIELDLDAGKYRFTLKDSFGDGFGSDGMFAMYIDGRELVRSDRYWFELSYDILAGHDPESAMTDRDKEWLVAHNVRRKAWHERHGETYVPLTWSTGLADDALSWATELLHSCEVDGIEHESGVEEGENLAKNRGGSDSGWGQLYPADNILTRWVENEEARPYPENAHLTQALWRASRYLGCGEAVKNYSDGSVCRIQVCRYIRAGNCNMAKYDATEGENWLAPMLMDHSICGPECPPEGCF